MTAPARIRATYGVGVPGALSLAVMGVLWRAGRPVKLEYVHRRVCEHYKPVTLSTVSCTLQRLRPAWVSRPRDGMYQAVVSRAGAIIELRDRLEGLIDDLTMAIEEV